MSLHFSEMGSGSPLVVLHGLYGSGDNWLSVAKDLSRWHKIYLVDLRNHGRSFHDPTMSYTEMANDLYNLVSSLNLASFCVLGHSMGGKVAMQFARLWPSMVKQLIVVDISPFEECSSSSTYKAHEQIVTGLMSIPIDEIVSREQANALLSKFVTEERVRQFLLKNLKREGNTFKWALNVGAIKQNMEHIMQGIIESSGTDRFHTKTLFVRGELSNYITDNCVGLIEKQFTNCEVVTISNSGHWVHAEQQQEFVKVIAEFLKE